MPTYIGCKPPIREKCPWQGSEEDHWRTTIYPVCKCGMKHCDEYEGYCPIRDDR